jgi:hypothetical protein
MEFLRDFLCIFCVFELWDLSGFYRGFIWSSEVNKIGVWLASYAGLPLKLQKWLKKLHGFNVRWSDQGGKVRRFL